MPIEFRCQQCQHLLRTGDDSAGKKARCPQCGAIQPVPGGDEQAAAPTASPFGETSVPHIRTTSSNPFSADAAPNPYSAPVSASARVAPGAKVLGPGIAMIAVSVISVLLTALILLGGVATVVSEGAETDDIVGLIIFAISFVIGLLTCIGSIQLVRMRTYSLAMTAVILNLAPLNCLWCVTMPFAIWALVVLLDPAVRAEFQ